MVWRFAELDLLQLYCPLTLQNLKHTGFQGLTILMRIIGCISGSAWDARFNYVITFAWEPKPVQTSQWLPPRHLLHANQSQYSKLGHSSQGRPAILLWWSTSKPCFVSACEPRFVLCDIWPLHQSWAGTQGYSILSCQTSTLSHWQPLILWCSTASSDCWSWWTNVGLVSSLAMVHIRAGNMKAWQLWTAVEKT